MAEGLESRGVIRGAAFAALAVAALIAAGCSASDPETEAGSEADPVEDAASNDPGPSESTGDPEPQDVPTDECGETVGCDREGDTANEGSTAEPDAATLAALDVVFATCSSTADGYALTVDLAGPGEPTARAANVKWYQLIADAQVWKADATWNPSNEDPGYRGRVFAGPSRDLETTVTAEWTSPEQIVMTLTRVDGTLPVAGDVLVTMTYRTDDNSLTLFDDARTTCG